MSMASLHGSRVAMQRIIDSAKVLVDEAAADDAAKQMKEPLNFDKFQRAAAKLEMSGKQGEAVEMLQKAWEEANKEGKQYEAHELQMLLVEMLVYKGKYEKAKSVCKKLEPTAVPIWKASTSQDLSIQLRGSRVEYMPNWRHIMVATKPDWEECMTKYKPWSQPPIRK